MKTATIAVVVIIALGAGWYFLSNTAPAAAPTAPTGEATPANTAPVATAPMSATITYGPKGFSPSSVIIAKGGTVNWVAAAGADELWVASNPHPTHQGYDGTTKDQHCAAGYQGPAPFDQCKVGTTYSFTFTAVGTWAYHNHGNHTDGGTVIVQ